MEEVIKMLPRYRVPVVKKSGSKKKTHEEYVAEVAIKNSNIQVVGRYIDNKTSITHKCLIHNAEWSARPSNILQGKGCPDCAIENRIKKNKMTHNEYVKQVQVKNSTIEVVGEYNGANIKILHHCLIHDIYWDAYPSNILRGQGCKGCKKDKIKEKRIKSHKEYVNELFVKNPNLEVIGVYMGSNTKITHHCLIHDVYWDITPINALSGCGCQKCKSNKIINKNLKSHEKYVDELSLINPNIIVMEQYIDVKTPILHKCVIHNLEWLTTPATTLQGCGCLECKRDKLSVFRNKGHEQYIEELYAINPNITVIEQYIDAKTPILHKCLKDGNEWFSSPCNMLVGHGCPKCCESIGEKQVRLWLDEHNISYETQNKFEDCRDINPLPFDFYLPDYNSCIEYDGKQHFEPVEYFGGQEAFEKTVKHDNIKNDYCKNHGISLLRIPYFKNVEEELNNFLLY